MTPESSDGNIDDPQWKWLEKELDAATARNELIVVIGHHATGSLTSGVPDEDASECGEPDEHGHDTNPGCDRDPRSSEPLHLGEETKELFLAHPNVVAFVAGHSHNNRVQPFKADGGSGLLGDQEPGDLRLAAAAAADRADGELRRHAVGVRHDARPRRPSRRPAAGPRPGGFSPAELASIGRVLTYNDPQGTNEARPASPRTATWSCCSTIRARPGPRTRSCRLRVKPRRFRHGVGRAGSPSASRPASGVPVRGAVGALQGQARGRPTPEGRRTNQGPAHKAEARRRARVAKTWAARSAGRASGLSPGA